MSTNSRDIIYPKPAVKVCVDKPISAGDAKKLMGWQEEKADEDFGASYQLKFSKKKVRCHNNMKNRSLYPAWARALAQEILNGRWRFNMQPIIIGLTGMIVSGQHRLFALILATELWNRHPDDYPFWEEAPTIPSVINFGCPEDDETVNTVDTGKTRKLHDILFRSEYLKDVVKSRDKKLLSKTASYCVYALWQRTGKTKDPTIRTLSECLNFLSEHPRAMACIRHVYQGEGGKEKRISRYLPLGTAAALLYLMGSSRTPAEEYYGDDPRTEDSLSWKTWEKACDYFTRLAHKDKSVSAVAEMLAASIMNNGGSVSERTSLVIKGWHCFSQGKRCTKAAVKLNYLFDEDDGVQHLVDFPLCGGIDLGSGEPVFEPDPTPDQIETRKRKVRKSATTV